MSRVLVDTSIWIDFFKGGVTSRPLLEFIENNTIVVNDLILAELLPSINKKNETGLKELLLSLQKVALSIDWHEIIQMQTENLKAGMNNIGIPDLIIAQNAIQNELHLFENDKHFRLIQGQPRLMFIRKEAG